jgi:integrase
MKVPKKKPEYLRPDEVALVLEQLAPRWRPLFATAFFAGLRKGELLALRKQDVDLVNGTITVRRSNNFDTTKGSHEDELPVANELRPFLEAAMRASKSDLVFPRPDGRQHPPDLQLQDVLRRALGRAGIVTGYEHVCRRQGCGYKDQRDSDEAARCPQCKMKLWVKPIPKQLRFHDTRHTTAALLLRAKVPLAIVQRVLRHSDPDITANVYGNIGMEDLRDAVNVLGDRVKLHLVEGGAAAPKAAPGHGPGGGKTGAKGY